MSRLEWTTDLCVVSGEHPKQPVISKTTGNVFERHLLETYLSENQTDPVTNESATIDDYVELKGQFLAF